MKKEITCKAIKLHIYPSTVYLVLAKSLDDAADYIEKHAKGTHLNRTNLHQCFARTYIKEASVYITIDMTIKEPLVSLVHELMHATTAVLNYAGVVISYENDEAMAYMLDYLFENTYKQIQKYNEQNSNIQPGSSGKID